MGQAAYCSLQGTPPKVGSIPDIKIYSHSAIFEDCHHIITVSDLAFYYVQAW